MGNSETIQAVRPEYGFAIRQSLYKYSTISIIRLK